MLSYDIGITEVNTQVRRLGYVSAILTILGSRTLSETLLFDRLEEWSKNHEHDLSAHANQQGLIKRTRQKSGARRYTEFVLALGLIGKVAGAYRVTRFGKTLLPFLGPGGGFELGLAECLSYLYWLFVKDGDRLCTVLDMLTETQYQPLSLLQRNFQDRYLHRLSVRLSMEEGRVAREVLTARNRVSRDWKNPRRYAENIVPPRIHWLTDLGIVHIVEGVRGKPTGLTEQGSLLMTALPMSLGDDRAYFSPSWNRKGFFGIAAPIMDRNPGRRWCSLSHEKDGYLDALMPRAFSTLRSSPAPKVSLYPLLIHMALLLAADMHIWANIEELQNDLDAYSRKPNSMYEVRFSHRENEAYLISKPI